MKYTILINQFAIQEAGFDLDLTDAAIFEVIKDYCNSTACRKMQDDGKPFFNVPYRIVIDELPLAKINKPDSVYRRFQKLEQYGIIEMHPDNKKMKQVWFAWGRNYDRMLFRSQTGSKSDQADLNPYQTGLESVLRPDLNPPHPNTISSNYPIEIEHAPEKSLEQAEIENLLTIEAEKGCSHLQSRAAPSWRDRPNTDTPDKMRACLQSFYEHHADDWRVMLDNAGARYTKDQCREIVTAFCSYQIENNRTANTYKQTHAALQRWFIGQKSMKQPAASKTTITQAGRDVEHYLKPQAF